MGIAIVTGASSGMGREFALQLHKEERFDELWVIARRETALESLRSQVPCPLRIIALDLTKKESLDTYRDLLAREKPEVAVLVNCAGFGKFGRYDQIPLQDCMDMIDLNCKALVAMTQLTLPYMKGGSKIVQLDSLSAFQPVPYINVYGSTKAFVLSYSRALNQELERGFHSHPPAERFHTVDLVTGGIRNAVRIEAAGTSGDCKGCCSHKVYLFHIYCIT